MRRCGSESSRWSPSQHTTTKSWATLKSNPDAPPEWLRRSYTRTVAKDVRTLEQLRLSFEDARHRWRGACDCADCEDSSSSSGGAATAAVAPLPTSVPRPLHNEVEEVVSQVRSIKQELLTHLTRLLGNIQSSKSNDASFTSCTGQSSKARAEEESWWKDLAGVKDHEAALPSVTSPAASAIMTDYLHALWLARRVWVWSICLACATMDLELLSGSVSFSTELFFGCPFISPNCSPASSSGHVGVSPMPSSYNCRGTITEQELYSIAGCVNWDSRGDGSAAISKVQDSEFREFYGCSRDAGGGCPTQISAETSYRHHADLNSCLCKEEDNTRLNSASSADAEVRDAFWVHAIALCYSIIAQDTANAGRLSDYFAKEYARQRENENSAADTYHSGSDMVLPHSRSCVARATTFVVKLAEVLLCENYSAAQELLRDEAFLFPSTGMKSGSGIARASTAAVNHEEDQAVAAALGVVCPEGAILVFLIRLLGEHVVRRRWTEQKVGQSFRPAEPVPCVSDGNRDTSDANPRRLVCALLASKQAVQKESATVDADNEVAGISVVKGSFWGRTKAMELTLALQITALRSMGGDWPLPGPLLRAAFGSI